MLGLYKWKSDVALITIVNNILDLVDNKPKEKRVVKRGRDQEWIKDRGEKVTYNNIVLDLFLHDEEGFRCFIRMNYEQFIELTEIIAPIVSKMDTEGKQYAPKTCITLRFLATRESARSLEYSFWISRKAVSYIIDEVCKAVVTALAGAWLKCPSCQEDWKNVEKNFKEKRNFLHCIGAVDVKHIKIIGCGMGSQCYNYKGANSIVVLVVAGSNYKVIWTDVGMKGRISDGGVLKRSGEEEGSLSLSAPEPLPGRSVWTLIGKTQFVQKVTFEPLMVFKQSHYGSWKYYNSLFF